MSYIVLAINPGSTSTKISVYKDSEEVFTKTLRHTSEELAPYKGVIDQLAFRKDTIMKALAENNVELASIDICVGRGGVIRPIPSGVYGVNDAMIEDIRTVKYGEHASNLGGVLALEISKEVEAVRCGSKVPAVIADPVVVDELDDVARLSGHPLFPHYSIFHALNQKAIAKRYAKEQGKKYEDISVLVAHLGGGVSVGVHKGGRVIDVNDALNGDGPFSPERSGSLPATLLINACFSGKYTKDEMKKFVNGKGGVVSYMNTNSMLELEHMVEAGDAKAKLVSDAFVYQLAKEIGAMSTVLCGKVDAILVTGGIAYSKSLMAQLKERVSYLAPVVVYPGEDEMGTLAANGLAVLNGEETIKEY